MNNIKTIIEFGFCITRRIMEIEEGVIRHLHNSSAVLRKPNSIIVNM